MPIIVLWNETVAGSERRIRQWLKSMELSNRSQFWWLRKRLEVTRRAEAASRAFPVFRFYNEAITARVSRFQFGALLDARVPSLGHHIVEAAEEWNVVRDVNNSVTSAQLLPELIRTLSEIVDGLGGSVARFRTPKREMFDLDKLDASALPGLAALTFRTLGQDRGALKRTAEAVHAAIESTAGSETEGRQQKPSEPLLARLDGMGRALDTGTRYVVAGLLLIPAVAGLVPRMAEDARLALGHWFIDLAERIETDVYEMRRRVLTVFAIDLPVAAEKAFVVVDAVRTYVLDNIRFISLVAVELLRGTFGGFTTFADQLRTTWDQVIRLINTIVATGEAVLDLDIGGPLHEALEAINTAINNINPLLRADPYDPPDEFPVTVGELVMNKGAGARAQSELQAGVRGLRKAWRNLAFEDAHEWLTEKISGYSPPKMIVALGKLVDALGHRQHVPAAVPRLTFDGSDMVDIGQKIVEPLRKGTENILDRLEADATYAIQGVGTAAHGALTDTAAAFDAAAVNATRIRSLRLIEGIAGDTDYFLRSVLGDQQASGGDERFDALAGQYAAWLVQGGFDVIGAAMAGYAGHLLDVWTAELDANEDLPFEVTETSPRKLLERARLGRVHTPRMRIAVRAESLGGPLAAQVADRFQTAIVDSYRCGQERLGEHIAAAPVEGDVAL